MPASFTRCVKKGGRVRTVKPSRGTYKPICYQGNKSYPGETRKTKRKGKK